MAARWNTAVTTNVLSNYIALPSWEGHNAFTYQEGLKFVPVLPLQALLH